MPKRIADLLAQVLLTFERMQNSLSDNIESIIRVFWVITLVLFVMLILMMPLVSPEDYGFITTFVKLIAILGVVPLVVFYGVWSVIDPRNAFLGLFRRWFFVEAQPSDLAIILTRAGGIVLIIMGIIVLVTLLVK